MIYLFLVQQPLRPWIPFKWDSAFRNLNQSVILDYSHLKHDGSTEDICSVEKLYF